MMMKQQQQHRRRRVFPALDLLLFSILVVLENGNVVSALLTTTFAPARPRVHSFGSRFTRPYRPFTRDESMLYNKNHDSHKRPSTIIAPSTTKKTFTALSSSTSSSGTSTSTNAASASSSSSPPPPPALSLENISCSHNGGETWQLKDVSYVLPRGAKVALVGRNGTGKSTLLKILAEHASCRRGGGGGNAAAAAASVTTTAASDLAGFQYKGQVTIPRNVRVAYVEQEPFTSSHVTVADALLGIRSANVNDNGNNINVNKSNSDAYSAVHAYRRAVDQAESNPQAFAAACAEMDAHNGSWDVWTKMEEVATKLRIRHLQDQPLSNLSGGERKRVSLAAALVLEPDVLLLDEPSNWLSLAGVQWLTDLLLKYDKKLTILMVTHDRIFLDQVCDRILELDQGSLYEYVDCDYAGYLQAKEERLALQDAAAQSARAKYRVELDWMRRQPQARQTKAKARIDAFYKLQKATKPRPQDPNLNLLNDDSSQQRRLGGKIISMRNVNLQFGDRVMLKDFSYDFCKGDRICISGANGVGKTTFLRLLTGEQPADSGDIEIGETIVLGIYDQMGLQLKADQDAQQTTVLAFVTEAVLQSFQVESRAMTDAPVEARRLLNKFEFPRSRWNERISVLSGGEKRRLQMLSVLSRRPNVLIMDEPSVDCDLDTIMALETYLEEFAGVLLIVSHDRAFASKVTDHLFIFEGDGEIKDFRGSLSEYASALVEIENQSIPGSSPSSSTPSSVVQGSFANDEKVAAAEKKEQINKVRQAKKDMDKLDRAMEKLREKAKTVQKELDNSNAEGWTKLAELTENLTALNDEIEEKEIQWMELAEIVEQAEVDTV